MGKKRKNAPSREDVIKAVASLAQKARSGNSHQRLSVPALAKQLRISIKVAIKCLMHLQDPEAYDQLQWGAGRPKKDTGITDE